MQRSELRQFARDQSVVESHEISDALIDTYLTEGYQTLLTRRNWPWAVGTEDIQTVAAKAAYNLKSDAKKIVAVLDLEDDTYLRSTTLERVVVKSNLTIATTTPLEFYFNSEVGNDPAKFPSLTLFPIPADVRDYTVWYRTAPLFGPEEDDVPPFDDLFHLALGDWASYRIWEVEEDLDRSDASRARYETRVMEMIEWYNSQVEDRPMIYGQAKAMYYPTNMPYLNDAAQGGAV